MKIQKWVELKARIPVEIEQGERGLVYVTSRMLRGLMIAAPTEKQALELINSAVEDLACGVAEVAQAVIDNQTEAKSS